MEGHNDATFKVEGIEALFRILQRVTLSTEAGESIKEKASQDLKGLSMATVADVVLAKEKFDKVGKVRLVSIRLDSVRVGW